MFYRIYQNEKPFLKEFKFNQVHRADCSHLAHEIIRIQFNVLGEFDSDSDAMKFTEEIGYQPKATPCPDCMQL